MPISLLCPVRSGGAQPSRRKSGERLLTAGRAEEAIAALEVATPKQQAPRSHLDDDLYGLGGTAPALIGKASTSMRWMPRGRPSTPSGFAGQLSRSASPLNVCAPT